MKLGCLVIICLAAAAFPAVAQERAADEVIRVSTTLVSVPVIVSDRQGRYIPDLTQAEFSVLQDGADQKIDFFAATEEPISVAVLIDTSQSTREVLGDIKSAAKKFIKNLQPVDKAMIVSFDRDVHILSPLTSDQEQLTRAVKSAEIPEDRYGTKLRDAVRETVSKQFAGVTGRKAIILLTDGKDHGSSASSAYLIHSLQESDVMIYSVFFKTSGSRPVFRPDFDDPDLFGGGRRHGGYGGGMPDGERHRRFPQGDRPGNTRRTQRIEHENDEATDYLRKLSDTTAGRYYESKKSKFKEVFALIADELRHQYRLGYYPPEDSQNVGAHSITVKVARPGLVVRARQSYRSKAK